MPAKTTPAPKKKAPAKKKAAGPVLIDPATLTDHPSLAIIPMLSESPDPENPGEWEAMIRQTEASKAIRNPVKVIVGTTTLVDGRHRKALAIRFNLRLPVEYISAAEAETVIRDEIFGRRHWTKSQLAWICLSLHPHENRAKRGRPSKMHTEYAFSGLDDLATSAGVSRALIQKAAQLENMIADRPEDEKSAIVARIWEGEGITSLVDALTPDPLEGHRGNGGRPPAEDASRNAWAKLLTNLQHETQLKTWAHLPTEGLRAAAASLTASAADTLRAVIDRPDMPAPEKAATLEDFRAAWSDIKDAAAAAGLNLK